MKKIKGFTLVELMFVILIISIIFAILMPKFTRMKLQAYLYSCEMTQKNLATALETYMTNESDKRYPASEGGKIPTLLVTERYINAMPHCLTNPAVIYDYEVEGQNYTISCAGNHSTIDVNPPYPQYTNRTGGFKISGP